LGKLSVTSKLLSKLLSSPSARALKEGGDGIIVAHIIANAIKRERGEKSFL